MTHTLKKKKIHFYLLFSEKHELRKLNFYLLFILVLFNFIIDP